MRHGHAGARSRQGKIDVPHAHALVVEAHPDGIAKAERLRATRGAFHRVAGFRLQRQREVDRIHVRPDVAHGGYGAAECGNAERRPQGGLSPIRTH